MSRGPTALFMVLLDGIPQFSHTFLYAQQYWDTKVLAIEKTIYGWSSTDTPEWCALDSNYEAIFFLCCLGHNNGTMLSLAWDSQRVQFERDARREINDLTGTGPWEGWRAWPGWWSDLLSTYGEGRELLSGGVK